MNFIDYLTTLQDGFAGTVFFFSDFFMHGILGRTFFRTTKSLDDASVRMGLMASGVWMLGNLFYHILVSKEKAQDKRARMTSIERLLLLLQSYVSITHSGCLPIFSTLPSLMVLLSSSSRWRMKGSISMISTTTIDPNDVHCL
jgi:hypothetical protein